MTETEKIYLAQFGHMAFIMSKTKHNVDEEDFPVWEDLNEETKKAWKCAAMAIARRVKFTDTVDT